MSSAQPSAREGDHGPEVRAARSTASSVGARSYPVQLPGAVRIATVDVHDVGAATSLDLSGARDWRILLTAHGVPVDVVSLPYPGRASAGMLEAAIVERADEHLSRQALEASLRRRFGFPAPRYRDLSCSVVVCTHRCGPRLETVLRALAALDPAPAEIVVVDNDPGTEDCRDQVTSAGFRYMREDRRGLNVARSTGMAGAGSDVVAFTDDDCEPPPQWLRGLPELFDDPLVAAVTGPAFPARLDTASHRRFEEASSFNRGLQRRRYDWLTFPPAKATITGAGANMIVRNGELGPVDLFPAELDAGTATMSGGDTYALYRLLAAGRRVVYDPATFTYHHHRADPPALHRAVRGYGTGLSAMLAKVLVEERDLDALRPWQWAWTNYLNTVWKRLYGEADPVEVRLAWDFLRGAVSGPAAWRRARRASGPSTLPEVRSTQSPADGALHHTAPSATPPAIPDISVVIPTSGRSAALARCLRALESQEGCSFEVVVVDDAPSRNTLEVDSHDPRVRTVSTTGRGAAAARNAGLAEARADVVVFLDDDLEAEPGLLAQHVHAHEGHQSRIVVGHSNPMPVETNLAAMAAAIWWEDYFRAKRSAAAATFTDVLTGNMSVRRDTFETIGSFDAEIGRHRREDWEWGMRALRAGGEVVYVEAAVAVHRFSLDTRGRLAAAFSEGCGDALLLRRHPEALPSLLAGESGRDEGGPRRGLVRRALRSVWARAVAASVLDCLELVKAWATWAEWASVVQDAAYEDGFRRSGGEAIRDAIAVDELEVALRSGRPIPAPGAAPPRLAFSGDTEVPIAVCAVDGQWTAAIAAEAVRKLPRALAAYAPKRPSPEQGRLEGTFVALHEAGAHNLLPELEAAGARTTVLSGAAVRFWPELDQAIRRSSATTVLAPLPGTRAGLAWARCAAVSLEGELVAGVCGAGLREHEVSGALELYSARDAGPRYRTLLSPAQYLGVRRDLYEVLGGFDCSTAHLSPQAPLLDFFERALAAGLLVAHRDTPGLSPTGAWDTATQRRGEWQRWQARGALITRDALACGPRERAKLLTQQGALPLLNDLISTSVGANPGLRGAIGRASAFAAGSVRAVVGAAH